MLQFVRSDLYLFSSTTFPDFGTQYLLGLESVKKCSML